MLKIYAQKDGILIGYDNTEASDWKKWKAVVNGRFYSCRDYRPLDGEGRQLKEDNRSIIRDLYPEALNNQTAEEVKEREARLKDIEIKAEEIAVGRTPKKSFAEALEDSFLRTLTETQAEAMVEKILPNVREKIITEFGTLPQKMEVKIPDRPPVELTGVFHERFDKIVNMTLDNIPVYLYGPAGTGKSFLARQLADALQIPYHSNNAVTDTITLTGFIDANGRYHETEFYKAFTQGGIYLLDELDASIPEVLVTLNECLANGRFPFPNGMVEAHKDFHPVAAGNTFGTGGDNVYTGRFQIDCASLDRFAMEEVNYDRRIEEAQANGDTELVDFAEDFRRATDKAGINCLFTYRGINRIYKCSAYMTKAEALKTSVIKGLPVDDTEIIERNMTVNNTWREALRSLINK